MAWNYININRSIFDRKKFQLTVGPSGPSVFFRKEGIADELYLHKNFSSFFDERSGPPTDEIYPTVTIRQIMGGG